MKIMLLNKAYAARVHFNTNPCTLCMCRHTNCAHILTEICVLYGGFQDTTEEIFKI